MNSQSKMKLDIKVVLLFSLISRSMEIGYKILKIEKCYGNGKQVTVEKCFVIDETLLNFRVNVLVGLDYSLVRTFSFLHEIQIF